METLHYSDPYILWKEKQKSIFSAGEIEILSPVFSQALAQATTDQMVEFSISTWKKDLVFGSDKYTSGMFFINQDGLNWVFGNVNLALGQEGEKFTGNPSHSVPKGVHVVAQEGQLNFRPSHRKWWEPKVFPNWVYAPAPFTLASEPAPTASAPSAISKPVTPPKPVPPPVIEKEKSAPNQTSSFKEPQEDDDLSQRLRKLKSLRDEGLISEEDYLQKKKEILKSL
jgi:hypothetical protein